MQWCCCTYERETHVWLWRFHSFLKRVKKRWCKGRLHNHWETWRKHGEIDVLMVNWMIRNNDYQEKSMIYMVSTSQRHFQILDNSINNQREMIELFDFNQWMRLCEWDESHQTTPYHSCFWGQELSDEHEICSFKQWIWNKEQEGMVIMNEMYISLQTIPNTLWYAYWVLLNDVLFHINQIISFNLIQFSYENRKMIYIELVWVKKRNRMIKQYFAALWWIIMIGLFMKSWRNHELKTFEHISENEGRECGSETMHACERFKYDCGQSDSNDGRTSRVAIPLNSSPISILFNISE